MKKFFTIIALLAVLVTQMGQVASAEEASPTLLPSLADLVRQEIEVPVTGVEVDLGAAGLCYNEAYVSNWLIQRSDDVIVGNYVGDQPVFTGFVGNVTRETGIDMHGHEVTIVQIDAESSYITEWGFVLTETTTIVDPRTTVIHTEVQCK